MYGLLSPSLPRYAQADRIAALKKVRAAQPKVLMFGGHDTQEIARRAPTGREPIWNARLNMAMEFGREPAETDPTPARCQLPDAHPLRKLDEINTLCQAAMKFRNVTVLIDLASRNPVAKAPLESFAVLRRRRYPWVDADSIVPPLQPGDVLRMEGHGLPGQVRREPVRAAGHEGVGIRLRPGEGNRWPWPPPPPGPEAALMGSAVFIDISILPFSGGLLVSAQPMLRWSRTVRQHGAEAPLPSPRGQL